MGIYDGYIELNQFVDPIRRNQQRVRYHQIAQVYNRNCLLFAELIIETRGGGTLQVPGLPKGSADEAASLILERM